MTKPKKIPVMIRMNPSGLELIDKVAADNDVSRTDVMRCSFSIALKNEKELYSMLAVIREGS